MQTGGEDVSRRAGWRMAAFAAIAALIAAFGAARLPPLDRDEARFAQATAQMLESGDFMRIRYLSEERNKKPAGSYWAQAVSVGLLSDAGAREIFYYRLPSILALVVAALATGSLATQAFSPATGLLAAAIAAALPVALIEGLIAKADAMLFAATAAAMALLVSIGAAAAAGAARKRAPAALMWLAIGAGVMIKGPVIALFVAPAMIALVATQKRKDWAARLCPATGAVILMLMIGPWLVAIENATEGRFLKDSLGGDMLAKIGAGKESHGAPPLTYAALAPVLFMPLIALAPAALAHGWRMRADWRFAVLLAAIVAPWELFEIAATQLPHYLLPVAPAFCALAAASAGAPGLAIARRIGAALTLVGAIALAGAPLYLAASFKVAPGAAGCVMLAAALALALLGAARHWAGAAAAGTLYVAASSFLLIAAALVIAPRLSPLWIAPRLAAALQERAPPNGAPVALAGYREPAAVFLLGPNARLAEPAEAAAMRAAGAAAIIENEALFAFEAALPPRCKAPAAATVDGYNYAKGRAVRLHVFAPCGGSAP